MVRSIIIFIIFLICIALFWFFVSSNFISQDKERERMWDDYNKRFK